MKPQTGKRKPPGEAPSAAPVTPPRPPRPDRGGAWRVEGDKLVPDAPARKTPAEETAP